MQNNTVQKSLDDLQPVKSESLDLKQFHNKIVKIEKADILQVPSKFTPLLPGSQTEHQLQWVLKVQSEIVASIGHEQEQIEFRASEIFNLVQDKDGNLIGYPENEASNLMKFLKDTGAKTPKELIGKNVSIKAYDRTMTVNDKPVLRTFLKFKY